MKLPSLPEIKHYLSSKAVCFAITLKGQSKMLSLPLLIKHAEMQDSCRIVSCYGLNICIHPKFIS